MKGHRPLLRHTWMVPVAVIALIAGHGIVLVYVTSHVALSTSVVAGVVALVAIKHLGLLGPAYALLRRYMRRRQRQGDA